MIVEGWFDWTSNLHVACEDLIVLKGEATIKVLTSGMRTYECFLSKVVNFGNYSLFESAQMPRLSIIGV
jgi:hypothetical protein